MGLWSKIGSALSNGFKAGKKFISDNAGTIANVGLTAVNPVAGGAMALARSKIGKQLWESGKSLASKAWDKTKQFANEHADTIGEYAAKGLKAGAAALDSYAGVPIGSTLLKGANKLAGKYAKDSTGWSRFAKGIASGTKESDLSKQLNSQSQATNESNGHVASGYSLSSTGNYYNGKNRKKSWVL